MEKKKQNHTEDNFSLYTFNRLVPENSASDISMYDWRICVIGLHEKGMELAKAFTTNFPTIGFDFAEKQNQTSGETPSNPQPSHSKRKKPALKHGVRCTTDTEDIKDYNFYVINLPDFSDADDQTISDYKKQLSETIGRTIACGDIVVCETLTDFSNCLSVVEQISGLKRHEDFFVGYRAEGPCNDKENPRDCVHHTVASPEIAKIVDAVYASVFQQENKVTYSVNQMETDEKTKANNDSLLEKFTSFLKRRMVF